MRDPDPAAGRPDRCHCGHPVEPSHRYCPDCGAPTIAPGLAGDADSPASPLLLDRRGEPLTDRGEVRTGYGTLGLRLGVVALVALTLGLGWALLRQPATEPTPEGESGDESASPAEEPATATDDEPEADDPPAVTVPPDGSATNAARPSEGRSTTTAAQPEPESGGPFLGEEVGLSLLWSSVGNLQVLDLDTGARRQVRGASGQPVGLLDGTVVLQGEGTVALFDLSDPAAEAVPLGEIEPSSGGWTSLAEVADGLVWVAVDRYNGEEGSGLFGYDTAGNLRADGDLPLAAAPPSSGLIFRPGGGVYQETAGGYERRSTGLLRAAGDELALIHECDDRLDCRSRWVTIDTWDDPGFPEAPEQSPTGYSRIDGADRWLIDYDWSTQVARIVEIATGRIARTMGMAAGFPGEGVTISDDGRWLVDPLPEPGEPRSIIVDLDSGTEWELPIPIGSRRAGLLVPSSELPAVGGS